MKKIIIKKVEQYQKCPRCNHKEGLYFSHPVKAWKCQFCAYDESKRSYTIQRYAREQDATKIKEGMKKATGEIDE